MSILATELICYGVASIPLDDASTTGGAIDATMRPVFTQFAGAAKVSLTSNAADTRNVTVTGRNAAGEYTSEVVALTGTSEVLSLATYERVLSIKAATTNSNIVTIKEGTAGTTRGTIPASEAGVYAMFINSTTPASSSTIRYEKLFWKNTNGTLSLTSSVVTLTADPSTKIRIGVAVTLGDTATIANRLAAPGGISFVDDSVAANVPNSQNLTASTAVGVWIEQTLASSDSPLKSTFTTQLSGNTT